MKKSTLVMFAFVAFAVTGLAAEKAAKPAVISQGQKVSITGNLVPGKITVFDFTSKYCPPCVFMSPLLDQLHARRDDLAVVKVDINRPEANRIDWQSPVAQQYELKSIPHFKIYNAEGRLIAEGDKAYGMVRDWIDKLGELDL